MAWTASSWIWLLIGNTTGLILGGLVGFVLGVRTSQDEWREALLMIIATMIVGCWVASVICSLVIGYVIPVGIHTVTGVVTGGLFGKDALRKVQQNGGAND